MEIYESSVLQNDMVTKKNPTRMHANLINYQVENCPALPGRNLISTCNRKVKSVSGGRVEISSQQAGTRNHHLITNFSFFRPSKRTQNSFTTIRHILDVLFILIFISTVTVCTSLFTLTCLYLSILPYLCLCSFYTIK